MADKKTFKERVKEIAIQEAVFYKEIFTENTYLIYSSNFKKKAFYILSAERDNYLHLIGVHTNLSAMEFFEKCIAQTLTEDDFDFEKPYQNENVVKGSVRRKIKCLPSLKNIFDNDDLLFEEDFKKNSIICALAASDQKLTLGFAYGAKSRPKTLLKGNELSDKAIKIDLILSKRRSDENFNKIVYGDISEINDYDNILKGYIDENLLNKLKDQKVYSHI